MSSGLRDVIRRANATRRPEDGIALRVAVLGAVLTGMLALAVEGAIAPSTATLLAVALPFAYWVSWRRRAKDNWHIKIGLTLAALLALVRFLGQLSGVATLDEIRFPLADLFLWIQVVHGFDLPQRRDLNFSLGSSLTLMAVAGSVSQDLRFGAMLVLYFAFATAAFVLIHRSEIGEDATTLAEAEPGRGSPKKSRGFPTRDVVRGALATALAGTLLFLVLPQPSGVKTLSLPFHLGGGLGIFSSGGLIGPGGDSSEGRLNGSSYFGLSDRMDLSVRGELSDDLVMRVRASAPALWRGVLFDKYDGRAWTGDQATPASLGSAPPYEYPSEFRSLGPRATVSQTFYLESEQPNAILAAGQPDQVWYDGSVSIDDLGGLRTDSTLTPGEVYSVISTRGAATPQQLRALPSSPVPTSMQRYLQLPSALPQRVGALAKSVTRDSTDTYDSVMAIEDYLRTNYRYSIDSPVPPIGRDAVDHFLFDAHVGFCEQFASATAVMLRTLGIPARIAAGYTTGHHNPFTGYYEVHASDAHSWVEVWFPNYGWYEFDPTFDVPPADLQLASTIPLARLLGYLVDKLSPLFPGGGRDLVGYGLLGALAATAGAGLWLVFRKARRPNMPARRPPAATPVARAFGRLEDALASRGDGRMRSETAAETIERSSHLAGFTPAYAVASLEEECYGPSDPDGEAVRAAVDELDLLTEATRSRGERPGRTGA